jgi:hypothetical protein
MLIVGTRAHLEDLDRSYTYAEDVSVTAVAVGWFPGGAGSLLPGTPRPAWGLLDGQRVVGIGEFDITPLVRLSSPTAQSLGATCDGALLVGLEGAHLLTVSAEGEVSELESFDAVPGRQAWTNPAGTAPGLGSIAVSETDVWYVSVHVGGLWRSADRGRSWRGIVPPEADVHEVVAGAGGLVAVAAAEGFGWSSDGGDTWSWTTDGLHGAYARAVALDGEAAFLTASTGPITTDGRLYRCRLGEAFAACSGGLPESFPFNLDSGSVTACGGRAALGTHDGRVFRSLDGGATWGLAAGAMKPVQVVRLSA